MRLDYGYSVLPIVGAGFPSSEPDKTEGCVETAGFPLSGQKRSEVAVESSDEPKLAYFGQSVLILVRNLNLESGFRIRKVDGPSLLERIRHVTFGT